MSSTRLPPNLGAHSRRVMELFRPLPLAERLAAWEAKAVDPYELYAIDASCGKGRPQGSPPAWTPWCDGAHS